MIIFHALVGTIALVTGAWNLMARKGTPIHKLIGYLYVLSMAVLVLTSFSIFELFGGFGPYHAMSLVSGITISLAVYFPLRREKYENWLGHHYMWITWSYVGLLMATGSHLFEYGPVGWPFWARALLYWGVPLVSGAFLIYKNQHKTIAAYSKS